MFLDSLIFAAKPTSSCPESTTSDLLFIYDLVNSKFLWLYPFSWAVVIVRKILA